MNPRILLALAWLATVSAAYFLGANRSSPLSSPIAMSSGRTPGDGAIAPKGASGTERETSEARESKRDVKVLMARARAELGNGGSMFMNFGAMMRALAPMTELNDEQIQEALAEVERSVRDPQQKMLFHSLLLGRWAEYDGPGAMAYAREKIKDQGPFGMAASMSVINTWSKKDPDAVWKWFLEARERGERGPMGGVESFLPSIFAGLATSNLDAAVARLTALPEHEKEQAISGIGLAAMDPSFRSMLLARAPGMTPELRSSLYRNILGNWAMTDSESAMAWVERLPKEQREELLPQASFGFMMSDPQRGAELLLRNATDENRESTYQNIVSQWVARDPQGAGEWLTKQPPGPQLDPARSSFAMGVLPRDPSAAMDWAKSIEGKDSRESTIQIVYMQWAGRDAAAANAALDTAGLAPERLKEIRILTEPGARPARPNFAAPVVNP